MCLARRCSVESPGCRERGARVGASRVPDSLARDAFSGLRRRGLDRLQIETARVRPSRLIVLPFGICQIEILLLRWRSEHRKR